jgi:hypothetical protein
MHRWKSATLVGLDQVVLSRDAESEIASIVGKGRNVVTLRRSVQPFLDAITQELRSYVAFKRAPDPYTREAFLGAVGWGERSEPQRIYGIGGRAG